MTSKSIHEACRLVFLLLGVIIHHTSLADLPKLPMPQHKIATSPKDGDLTIETLYSLGFDRELVDFAVYHSNDDLFDAVDNLLEKTVRVSAQPTQYQLESSEPCPFRQRPAAKQKPPASHTSPIRYGIKRINLRTPVSQGSVPKRIKPNESFVEARASGEVAVKTNVPMEHNKEIVDLTANDIKTEGTPDPSTHKVSPNDSKPNGSLVDALVKVEETVENDLLAEQNDETIDPIENDSNVVDDQGVGAVNNDYNDDGSGSNADLDDSFDDNSSDDHYADDDEGGKLQEFIKNGRSVNKTKTLFEFAHNQVGEEMAELGNDNDLDEPPDQWAENLLRHLQKPLVARPRHESQSTRAVKDQDCFIKAIEIDENWRFIHQRIMDIEREFFPSKYSCLIRKGGDRSHPDIRLLTNGCTCVKGKHKWRISLRKFGPIGARKSSPTIDEVKSWFNQSYHNTICDSQFCSRPSHLLDENAATIEARRRCRANARNRLGYSCRGGTDRLPHNPPCLPTSPTTEESTHSELVGTPAHISGFTWKLPCPVK
ncbi:hypothetical protein BELL_0256g00100 [Botrytis elliptica]|uniref:UBA domain-containing protein n=1 Tax=Botrytis elliptica TaxID=278938 RepID=A0A4Z1JM15_9HELO|nr:hypothetical protein BELL_0256g00100 [Botrytis elliptica]